MQYFIEYENRKIETDKNGYLLDHNEWQKGLAPIIAKSESIETE